MALGWGRVGNADTDSTVSYVSEVWVRLGVGWEGEVVRSMDEIVWLVYCTFNIRSWGVDLACLHRFICLKARQMKGH